MAGFSTDAYATSYQYLPNAFTGSLQPRTAGSSSQAGVKYRKLATSKANVEWAASVGLTAELQTFEIWSSTLTVGYSPGIGDVWTDKDGQPWQIVKVDDDPLQTSTGQPVRFFVIAQRAK